jgi:CheY-like chemotaxis protein
MDKIDEAPLNVLVVDDSAANRNLFSLMLKKCGHNSIVVENGQEAVDYCLENPPDLILMDVMMPVLDGIAATRIIKKRFTEQDIYVPVIFLTALNDEDSLSQCLDAGGDDFVSKPISMTVFKSKINAAKRTIQMKKKMIGALNELQEESNAALEIHEKILKKKNIKIDNDIIDVYLKSSSNFCGDVFLSQLSPSGDIHFILGDVSGHGLKAALAVSMAAQIFTDSIECNLKPEQVLYQINRKLLRDLPVGMYICVHYGVVDSSTGNLTLINCGMRKAHLLDRKKRLVKTVESGHLPLGAAPTSAAEYAKYMQEIAVNQDTVLLLNSDGMSEAENSHGESFDHKAFNKALLNAPSEGRLTEWFIDSLHEFMGQDFDGRFIDDVSLAVIDPNKLANHFSMMEKGFVQSA